MAIPESKKQWLRDHGVSEKAIIELDLEMELKAKMAGLAGLEFKAKDFELEKAMNDLIANKKLNLEEGLSDEQRKYLSRGGFTDAEINVIAMALAMKREAGTQSKFDLMNVLSGKGSVKTIVKKSLKIG